MCWPGARVVVVVVAVRGLFYKVSGGHLKRWKLGKPGTVLFKVSDIQTWAQMRLNTWEILLKWTKRTQIANLGNLEATE